MAGIPTAEALIAAEGLDRRAIQEMLVLEHFRSVGGAVDFENVCLRAFEFSLQMSAAGYSYELLDEDGESMLAFGCVLMDGRSIASFVHWSLELGPSVSWTFFSDETSVRFACTGEGFAVFE